MKSLKRTLCLVLALVMVLGLFGVASAAKFPDDNTIQYKEAVDVMTGIGAINGQGDGNFNPKGNITRAEAAKLVTYTMLGEASAKKLSAASSSFSDVTAANYAWAIPSIEYLVKEGVINGRGDGTFDPDGKITGYELGKMLLCALGYGAKDEYVGSQWTLNVAIDGNRLGYAWDGNDESQTARRLAVFSDRADNANTLGSPATREEAALYCFNTIQKSKVEYVASLDVYASDGDFGMNIANIASDVYSGLDRAAGGADAYGRPAAEWTYGANNTIATAAEKPILTYTATKTAKAVGLEIANAGYKIPASGEVSTTTNNDSVADAAITDATFGNGTLVEIYANEANKEINKVVRVTTSIYKVTNVTADDAATTKIDESALTLDTIAGGAPFTASAVLKTENFAAVYPVAAALYAAGQDVYVTAVKCGGGETGHSVAHAIAIGVPQTATGTVTSVTKAADGTTVTNFTADGKTYAVGAGAIAATTNGLAVKDEVTIVMDSYGYVLLVNAVNKANNFAVVTAVDNDKELFGTAVTMMKILNMKGEEQTIATTLGITDGNLGTARPKWVGHVITYSPATGANEDKFVVKNGDTGTEFADTLEVVEEATKIQGTSTAQKTTDRTGIVIKNGAASFTIAKLCKETSGGSGVYTVNGTASTDVDTVVANNETVFVMHTDNSAKNIPDTFAFYTGVNNVPSMGGNSFCIVRDATTHVAKVVVVLDGKVSGGVTGLTFLIVDKSKSETTADGSVYAGAIIEGTNVKPVSVDTATANLGDAQLLSGYTADSKTGIITAISPVADNGIVGDVKAGYGIGVEKAANDLIKLSTAGVNSLGAAHAAASHTYEANCAVWEIDPSKPATSGRFTPKSIAQVATDGNDVVIWVENKDTGKVSALYVIKSEADLMNVTVAGATPAKYELTNGDPTTWKSGSPTAITATATAVTGSLSGVTPTYKWEVATKGGSTWVKIDSATTSSLTLPAPGASTTDLGKILVKAPSAGTANVTVRCTVTAPGFASKSATIDIEISEGAA